MSTTAILIEADPKNTLGGSCIRDLYNMSNHLSYICNISNTYVLTNNNISDDVKCTFSRDCNFVVVDNFTFQFINIINTIPANTTLFLLISGHGYQMKDDNGDEDDGKDEYIIMNKIIKDDLLKQLIYSVNDSIYVVCVCDTCHSGSMFDLDYTYINNEWINDSSSADNSRNIISISACKDNQLENCDIGNIGFGGALCVHLIDNNYVRCLIDRDIIAIKQMYNELSKILSNFNQIPVIQTSCVDFII
jgi:hypothetical protein